MAINHRTYISTHTLFLRMQYLYCFLLIFCRLIIIISFSCPHTGLLFLTSLLHSLRSAYSSLDIAISPSPFWSTPPPSAFHFHIHNPSHYTVLFLSHNRPIPLESPFLGFLGYFGYLSSPSDSLIPYFIHPFYSTHPSQHPHLCHIKPLSLSLFKWPCFCPVNHRRPHHRLIYFSFYSCTDLSVA